MPIKFSGVKVLIYDTVYDRQTIKVSQNCIDDCGETCKIPLLLCTPSVAVSS